jgi:formate hydrogenlyase subunit 3/multisubunit Na+/H+ antiporter MnhD subunit
MLLAYVFLFLLSAWILIFRPNQEKAILGGYLAFALAAIQWLWVLFSFLSQAQVPQELILWEFSFLGHHYVWSVFFDWAGLVYSFFALLSLWIGFRFSIKYLHLEPGNLKFFGLLPLILAGILIASWASSFEFFFLGWEWVGMSSFFLIAFYSYRTRAIRNAFRVFVIYKICDVGLLFSSILSHHGSQALNFYSLAQGNPEVFWELPRSVLLLVTFLSILASLGKSALFPFVNWPSRAMEGPTPSSAIFYGGAVLHLGVFLLYRLRFLLQQFPLAQGTLLLIGGLSFLYARLLSHTQSNVKGKIAYQTVSHVGLMAMEIAIGLEMLFLFHLTLHITYRVLQLLTSPSVMARLAHLGRRYSDLGYSVGLNRWYSSLYVLSLQEGFLSPSERGGGPGLNFSAIKFFAHRHRHTLALTLGVLAFVAWSFEHQNQLTREAFWLTGISLLLLLSAIYVLLKILLSYPRVQEALRGVLVSCILFSLSQLRLDPEHWQLSAGFMFMAFWAFVIAHWSYQPFMSQALHSYYGGMWLYPKRYRGALVSMIIFAAYPLSPMFLLEDAIYSRFLNHFWVESLMIYFYFLLLGVVVARLMVKVFWGFHYRALINPIIPPDIVDVSIKSREGILH